MTDNSNSQTSNPESHWEVERDMEKCSLCEVCTRCCPTGALQPDLKEDTLTILFRPEFCDGCGKCMEHCPEDASKLVKIDTPAEEGKVKVLVESKMLRCAECESVFAPESKLKAAARKTEVDLEVISEKCPLCRRTQLVANFIEEKRKFVGRKAEYKTGPKWYFKPVVDGDKDGPPCREILDEPATKESAEEDQAAS